MATKIKKCLYVGIGGTGMRTLLETKKFFIETYGEVPPCIAFLGIDTDGGAFDKTLPTKLGVPVGLTAGEVCRVQEAQPKAIYNMYKNNVYTWMPAKNVDALQTLTIGAGQVRTNGRFAFAIHYKTVQQALEKKLTDITNAQNATDANYEILDGKISVSLIFSLGGGTGCGSFIDVAYLIKKVFSHHPYSLWPYALLPNIFRNQLGKSLTNNVFANAFGAIQDVDYLMGMNAASRIPLRLKYTIHDEHVADSSPFDIMMLIDNKDERGNMYTTINQLTNMLGLALVTTAGDFGANIDTPLDNACVAKTDGTYDVENKLAWACKMGMSQILFDGDLLGQVYSIKSLLLLIRNLNNIDPQNDINTLANTWIAKPEVNIKEDQGHDDVINYLLQPIPEVSFSESSISNNRAAQPDVDNHLNLVAPKAAERDQKIKTKLTLIEEELKAQISANLNNDCGIGTSLAFIDELLRQIAIWEGEMQNERVKLEKDREIYWNKVTTEVSQLADAAGSSIFGRGRRTEEAQAVLVASVNEYARLVREVFRRDGAITLYAGLKSLLESLKAQILTLQENLNGVMSLLTKELDVIQNSSQSQSFVYPLHVDIAKTMKIDASAISVNQLAKSIDEEKGLFAIFDAKLEDIKDKLLHYSDNLPQTLDWKQKSIDDILQSLPDNEYNRIIKLTIDRSSPLLSTNYHGRMHNELANLFIVGTPNAENSILRTAVGDKRAFQDLLGANHRVEFTSTGSKDSVLIYRLSYVIPAFAISSIDLWEQEYYQVKKNCHFDANVHKLMLDENFSIHPKDSANELCLELWVKSFIFGRITNEGGIYKLKTHNKELAKAIDDYKCPLNENVSRREDAYKQFEKIFALVKDELEQDFLQQSESMGKDQLHHLYEDVKANYYTKYAQTGLTIKKLNGVAYKDIKELIDQELEYIEEALN